MMQLHEEPLLEPYLTGLNICDAVESFAKLADRLLLSQPTPMSDSQDLFRAHNSGAPSMDSDGAGSGPESAYESQCAAQAASPLALWSPPLSPAETSRSSSCSQWLSSSLSSGASSPAHPTSVGAASAAMVTVGGQAHGGPWSSASSQYSCAQSSGRASVCSFADELSLGPMGDWASVTKTLTRSPSSSASASSFSSSSCSSRSSASHSEPQRRIKNASAAERYRRKLKNRKCGLAEQVEREEARNRRLRDEVQFKLALYREFAAMLASQTGQSDLELASLGQQSIGKVLGEVLGASPMESRDEREAELRSYLERFRGILQTQNSAPQQIPQQQQQQQQQLVYC